MTREQISAMFMRRWEQWNRRDTTALVHDFSEDSVVETPLAGGSMHGRKAIEDLYLQFFHAFPDARLQMDDLLIDGERVTLVGRMSGTDTGGFMGVGPTGRSFDIALVLLYQLRDGLIVHERRIYDFTGMLLQVGALKAKPV